MKREVLLCTVSLLALMVDATVLAAEDPDLPEYVEVCRRDDENLADCMKKSAEKVLPHLANGVPEFNVPPVDPMIIESMSVHIGGGPISLNLTFKDTKHIGLKTAQILKIKPDLDKNRFYFNILVPRYHLIGPYEMNGRFLLFPITGSGPSNITLLNLSIAWVLQGTPVQRNGKEYIQLQEPIVKINIGKMYMDMQNLFNGQRSAIGENLLSFLNNNWKSVFVGVQPTIEVIFSKVVKGFVDKLFDSVEINKLFPPS